MLCRPHRGEGGTRGCEGRGHGPGPGPLSDQVHRADRVAFTHSVLRGLLCSSRAWQARTTCVQVIVTLRSPRWSWWTCQLSPFLCPHQHPLQPRTCGHTTQCSAGFCVVSPQTLGDV